MGAIDGEGVVERGRELSEVEVLIAIGEEVHAIKQLVQLAVWGLVAVVTLVLIVGLAVVA